MSCYEWERGTIVIPRSEWSDFRKAVIGFWNYLTEERYERARELKGELQEYLKGTRGAKRDVALDEFMDRLKPGERELVAIHVIAERSPLKLQMPKKRDFAPLPVSKSCTIEFDEATIILDNDNRTVRWEVMENNHACDTSREHPMGAELFRLLRKVKWGRGSGGHIIGNDEYNREDGDGQNYVTAKFGPLGDKDPDLYSP